MHSLNTSTVKRNKLHLMNDYFLNYIKIFIYKVKCRIMANMSKTLVSFHEIFSERLDRMREKILFLLKTLFFNSIIFVHSIFWHADVKLHVKMLCSNLKFQSSQNPPPLHSLKKIQRNVLRSRKNGTKKRELKKLKNS